MDGVVVLGLPRGGVPVAYEVANALNAPLDVILVRKIGAPFRSELAMGAIGEEGVRIVNDEVVRQLGVSATEFAVVETRERRELARRARLFRGERGRVSLVGQTALIVDDGIATGSTARAACQVARAYGAARVVVATPVASRGTVDRLRGDADEVVVLDSPEAFRAIGEFYDDFSQTSDEDVIRCLGLAT
ncbi:MAG TPA: phosphoribosyltransferase family protein [Acidimicrobiia bacterium]